MRGLRDAPPHLRRAHARRFLPVVQNLSKAAAVPGRESGVPRLLAPQDQVPGRARPPRLLPPPVRGPERAVVIRLPRPCVTPMSRQPTVRRFTPRRGTPPLAWASTIVTAQRRPLAAAGAGPRRPIRLRRHALLAVVSAGAASVAARPSTPPVAGSGADHSAATPSAAVSAGAVMAAADSAAAAIAKLPGPGSSWTKVNEWLARQPPTHDPSPDAIVASQAKWPLNRQYS